MKQALNLTGRMAVLLAVGVTGGIVGRNYPPARVRAQDKFSGNCTVTVPKTWGEFRGASAYGLAFQDANGTLRFLLHPACGNLSSYTESGGSDLEVQRR